MRTQIIYEDTDILVVQKPAGIAVQTAQVGRQDVVSELKNYLSNGKAPYLGVIHRLDQPVEGLLVFAKNPKAAAELNRQLAKEDFSKEYLAVVCGKPAAESGELVDYLVKDGSLAKVCEEIEAAAAVQKKMQGDITGQNIKSMQSPVPKRAALQYELKEALQIADEDIALLQIKLETGRFHQIRVQLSHAGCPILGDTKYGSEKSKQLSAQAGIRSTALCAFRLKFMHPTLKKEMQYTVTPQGEAFQRFTAGL